MIVIPYIIVFVVMAVERVEKPWPFSILPIDSFRTSRNNYSTRLLINLNKSVRSRQHMPGSITV